MIIKMHPIALLSVVDHHTRSVGARSNKRAMGILLGEHRGVTYEITNSYAIPFAETKDDIFYLDHNFHEKMFRMFKKINVKEKVLGWYVTGKTFKKQDLEINELIAEYCDEPVLIVVDVAAKQSQELPTKAFISERRINEKGFLERNFKNLTCYVSAYEAEEVGVEHLVREIKDLNMNSLQN